MRQKIGNYVTANYLSEGTIDALYMSLRMSGINDLSPENMPIFFDETFAYFDKNRLENILRFLEANYKDKQIIIFTCTEREIDILDNINLPYNKVHMNGGFC